MFHESARNVGIVGILLGLLVVAGLCGLGLIVLSGLNNESKGLSIEARLENQKVYSEEISADLKQGEIRFVELEGYQEKLRQIARVKVALAKEREGIKLAHGTVLELQDGKGRLA